MKKVFASGSILLLSVNHDTHDCHTQTDNIFERERERIGNWRKSGREKWRKKEGTPTVKATGHCEKGERRNDTNRNEMKRWMEGWVDERSRKSHEKPFVLPERTTTSFPSLSLSSSSSSSVLQSPSGFVSSSSWVFMFIMPLFRTPFSVPESNFAPYNTWWGNKGRREKWNHSSSHYDHLPILGSIFFSLLSFFLLIPEPWTIATILSSHPSEYDVSVVSEIANCNYIGMDGMRGERSVPLIWLVMGRRDRWSNNAENETNQSRERIRKERKKRWETMERGRESRTSEWRRKALDQEHSKNTASPLSSFLSPLWFSIHSFTGNINRVSHLLGFQKITSDENKRREREREEETMNRWKEGKEERGGEKTFTYMAESGCFGNLMINE